MLATGLEVRWRAVLWLGILVMGGCGPAVDVIGLRQEHPRGRVDSLQPTLRWEAFHPGQLGLDPGRVRNVTYDVRLWTAAREGGPLAVAYARDGLMAPEHRVETSLAPGCRYHWAVRARFELDGQAQVTPWSATMPKTSTPLTDRPPLEPPSPSAYRSFTTPPQ